MPDINLSGLNSSYLSGTTAQRPASSSIGALYFNTDLGCLQIYTSSGWFVYQNPAIPLAPTNVVATNQGSGRAYNNGQASVAFTPTSTGGVASSFTVTSSPGSYTGTGSSSPITITGLQSSTQYAYTVTATNLLATSSASSASSGVTATTVPQAPIIGTANAGNAQASVDFTPGATGGSAITSYTVTSSPGNITSSGASSPITVTGLTNGTSYTFTVTATNANGTSAASDASNSITPTEWNPEGVYDALATIKLSTSASSITFEGIPTGYKHLQIRMLATYTGSVGSGFIAFNGDNESGNYSYHALGGDGSSPGVAALASQNQGKFTGFAGTSSTQPNAMIMDILDYSSVSKYKTTRALYAWDGNGTGYVEFNSNNWRSLSAITSIVLTPFNTFNTNTSVALYGVK